MKSLIGLIVIVIAVTFSVAGQTTQSDFVKPIIQISLTDNVDDLSFLDKWVGKKKVIGLGEVTHGSKEIFEFKVRLVQYLALKKNAKAVVIETNMAQCYDINKFIITGEGNPSELIKNLKIATLNYKELVDLLVLLKDINKTRKLNNKIEFWGYDVQAPQSAAKMALSFFEKSGLLLPDSIKLGVSELINTGKSIFSINPKNVATYGKSVEIFYNTFQSNKKQLIKTSTKADYFFNERLIYSIKQSFMLFTAKSEMDAFFMRDKLGFDNIRWIVENKKKYPVIYWAHNAHVLKKELFYDNFVTTGNCLANAFKSDYLAIGSVFYEGTVRAIKDEKKPTYEAVDLPLADSTSAETFFSKQEFQNFFLNISQVTKSDDWKKVLTDSTTIRSIGSAYQPNVAGRNYRKTIFNQQYDLIFFIRKSSIPTENK